MNLWSSFLARCSSITHLGSYSLHWYYVCRLRTSPRSPRTPEKIPKDSPKGSTGMEIGALQVLLPYFFTNRISFPDVHRIFIDLFQVWENHPVEPIYHLNLPEGGNDRNQLLNLEFSFRFKCTVCSLVFNYQGSIWGRSFSDASFASFTREFLAKLSLHLTNISFAVYVTKIAKKGRYI